MGNAIRFLKSRIAKLPLTVSESEAKASLCADIDRDPDAISKVPGRKDINFLDDLTNKDNLQLLNLMYDATPSEYVSMIITDYGMIPPTSVPVIVREYGREHLWIQ
ncbi:hypothetical protein NC653_028462 [Populus alba x Populus x berolinensis]|uniref:Translation initiation factor eIF2B subunit delta n=1 Tax=Populus alba x Populus x berolinensis TaxID=444605 RepID=A0AAD6LZW4_9ROSI|nr:hypothetical protein NC653_028462 [Populus alba x Populus x berolinensis]